MMTLHPILVMFVPPLTTRDAIDVTPAKRATTPKVLSRSPFPLRRDEDGCGLPTCCNRDPFVPRATLGTVWAGAHVCFRTR